MKFLSGFCTFRNLPGRGTFLVTTTLVRNIVEYVLSTAFLIPLTHPVILTSLYLSRSLSLSLSLSHRLHSSLSKSKKKGEIERNMGVFTLKERKLL